MEMNDILDIVRSKVKRLEWQGFRAVPNDHCFAVYNIPKKEFSGADETAFLREFPLEITFFYRESKLESDFRLEYEFENAVRAAGEFSCVTGYESEYNLFFTSYTFSITENIDNMEE